MKKKMFGGAGAPIFNRARALRKTPTHAEEVLWQFLRQKPNGYKFRRQHPYAGFILDFYCHNLKLTIEVDGKVHDREDVKNNDREREAILKDLGLTIIRFSNEDVLSQIEKVTATINHSLSRETSPQQKQSDVPKSPL